MDNHGYFYRYDKINKSIIKTSSLDGKPLDSTLKDATNEFRGILGLNYTNNGLSIIAY